MRNLGLLGIPFFATACSPASVAEAEARHDVAWLESHESRSSIEALGRLADHDPQVATRLAPRTNSADVNHAAWQAHTRGARWGAEVLHAALASPTALPVAVAELPARDPRLDTFAPDLERGITLTTGAPAVAASTLVASLGPSAQPVLARLLDNAVTRGAVCTGLAAASASDESRLALTTARSEARLVPACRETILQHATSDVRVLDWVGEAGEPELVVGAARTLDCTMLARLWERVFASSREELTPFEPALAASVARCGTALDPLLSRTLSSTPRVRGCILHALDSDTMQAAELDDTCKQLPRIAHARSIPDDVRNLASGLLAKRCKPAS